jgi:hypothetical protein
LQDFLQLPLGGFEHGDRRIGAQRIH